MKKTTQLLYLTSPELIQYLANKDDAYKYTRHSKEYILVQCPCCGFINKRSVRAFTQRPTYCKKCSDGVSYPNKFMLNLLLQLGLDVEPEKQFTWSMKKIYDDYIEQYNMIIENHGEQHYKEIKSGKYKTLKEQIDLDVLKKNMALKNNIKHYVVIDCRKSEMEWIKQSVMNSILPDVLHFSENDINWNACDLYAQKSLLIEACRLWQNNIGVVEISNRLKLCRLTVTTYLKRGTKLGLCDYNPYIELQKILLRGRTQENEEKKCKPIAVYNSFGITHIFKGATYLSTASKELFGEFISRPMITLVCSGKAASCKGVTFKQISNDEYNKYYQEFGGEINPNNSIVFVAKNGLLKPVIVYKNKQFVGIYTGCDEAAEFLSNEYNVKFNRRRIKDTCLGKQKQYKGFIFKHITKEEYLQYKMTEQNEKNNNNNII